MLSKTKLMTSFPVAENYSSLSHMPSSTCPDLRNTGRLRLQKQHSDIGEGTVRSQTRNQKPRRGPPARRGKAGRMRVIQLASGLVNTRSKRQSAFREGKAVYFFAIL